MNFQLPHKFSVKKNSSFYYQHKFSKHFLPIFKKNKNKNKLNSIMQFDALLKHKQKSIQKKM